MKKTLFTIFCAVVAISCATDEVTVSNDLAISFENAFVDPQVIRSKVTDPTITTDKVNPLDKFKVWGFMDATSAVIFDGEVVEKQEDGQWTYGEVQYWAPNHTYYFGALAPVDNCHWVLNSDKANEFGIGELTFVNSEGTEDLLYASKSVETHDDEKFYSEGVAPVMLNFSHLLSKIKFTFTNGFGKDNITMNVSEIKMTVPKNATINLAVENWWDNDDWKITDAETSDLDFGVVPDLDTQTPLSSTNERLTIPAGKNASYAISFKVNIFIGGQPAMEVTKTATLTGVAFNMGRSYNIKADITPDNLELKPIEFEVEVKDWIPEGEFDLTLDK